MSRFSNFYTSLQLKRVVRESFMNIKVGNILFAVSTIYSENYDLLSYKFLFQGPLKYLPIKKSLVSIIIGMTIHGFGLGASVVGGKQSRWWRYKVMINFPRILGRAQVCHQVRLPRHHRHLWPRVRPLDLRVCFRRLRGWVCASQNGVIKMVSSVLLSSRHWKCYLTTHSIMFQVRLSAEFCMTRSASAGPSSSSSSESSSPSSGSSGWQSYYSSIHFPHLLLT